jgi:hypothetical protein
VLGVLPELVQLVVQQLVQDRLVDLFGKPFGAVELLMQVEPDAVVEPSRLGMRQRTTVPRQSHAVSIWRYQSQPDNGQDKGRPHQPVAK